MGTVRNSASESVGASPGRVLEILRDYAARPELLTDNYSQYRVEAGGSGAGTVVACHFAAGGRERDYRLRVEEEDGVLRERDKLSSFVSTWTVSAVGAGSKLTLEASWDGAGGIGGAFEGLFAPVGSAASLRAGPRAAFASCRSRVRC
ncbi:MAG: SRPBCC family protein [Solirubrobacteraceae bacterium]